MGNRATLTFPITKRTQQPDGSVIVEGDVTDDSLDLDGQIVDPTDAAKSLQGWFDDWANVRQQHSPILAPAGKGMSLKFRNGVPHLVTHVIEPTAVKLVNAGVYQAYSIGIADGTLDTSPTALKRAPGGILHPILVNEVSLVDYPANVGIGKLSIAKRKGGVIVETGKVKGFAGLAGDSLVEALKGLHSGAIVHTAKNDQKAAELIGTQFPASDYIADGNVIRVKRQMDPDVGGGVDRDKIPSEDFAGKGRTFPIVTPGDVSDAASSIGRAGPDNYSTDTLKANIIEIAQRKGPSFVAELPKKWRKEMGTSQKAKKAPGSKKPFPGAAPPFGSDERAGDDTYTTKEKAKGKKKSKKGKVPPVDQDVTDDLEKTDAALSQAKDDQAKDNAAHTDAKGKGKKKSAKAADDKHMVSADAYDKEPDGSKDDDDDSSDDDTTSKSEKGSKKKLSKAASRMAKEAKKARKAAAAEAAAAMKRAHDALCPAYKASATKSLDTVTAVIDPDFFLKRLGEVGDDSIETRAARKSAYGAAAEIATLTVKELTDLRRIAHKAFTDAYPDVKVKTPDLSDPASFQRGFLPSANKETSSSTSKPSNFPDAKPLEASGFTRGPLTTNEARPSLVGGKPATSMVKGRQFYTNADKDKNAAAMATLHDHIVDNYPSVCPAANGLADETGDRLGTPAEMYSSASPTTDVNTKGDATLVGVSAADAAKATKRAVKVATKRVEAKFAKRAKRQAKKIATLERTVRKELAKPDYAKSAQRATKFASTHAEVTPIVEGKRERLQRAKRISERIHDRHSGASLDEVEEMQGLVSAEEFAAMMVTDND